MFARYSLVGAFAAALGALASASPDVLSRLGISQLTALSAMFVFYALGLILTIGYFAFVGAFFVVLFLLVRWQVRYGELLTNDPDFLRARRSKNIALLLLIIAFPLGVVLNPFLDVILENLGLIGSSDEIGNLWLTKKVFAAVLFQ